jgi:hypothetical protein
LRQDRVQPGVYPFTVPWLLPSLDLQLSGPVTFLVGENDTGKSTLHLERPCGSEIERPYGFLDTADDFVQVDLLRSPASEPHALRRVELQARIERSSRRGGQQRVALWRTMSGAAGAAQQHSVGAATLTGPALAVAQIPARRTATGASFN